MTNEITNYEDVIDSRDVIARIEELEGDREAYVADITAADEELTEANDDTSALKDDPEEIAELARRVDAAKKALADFDEYEGKELKALKALAEEAEGYGEWEDGTALIRESYFTEYAQELCEDIGDVPRDLPHYIAIDWEATARNLKVDYMTVDFDGVDYLMQS